MAESKRLELATREGRHDEVSVGLVSSSMTIGLVLIALILTFGSLVLSGFCLWTERQLRTENAQLEENIGMLGTRVQLLAEELLSKMALPGGFAIEEGSHEVIKNRLRRDARGGGRRGSTRPPHHGGHRVKAVHFQLIVPQNEEIRKTKWTISNLTDSAGRSNGHQTSSSSDLVELQSHGHKVKMLQGGLYFIYVQIVFENARPRNAFSVKVDDTDIVKCFQSLDYFNRTLIPKDNYRLKPCYSAAAVVLRKDQILEVVNLYDGLVYNDSITNYWGLVRMSE